MVDVPTLETARLVLHGRTLADFDDYARMWADASVARYTSGTPLAREDAWRNFGRLAGVWALTGYGPWVVREKGTGAFVGDVGPADYRRDSEPSFAGMIEFGWALDPSAQGKGYAREALAATLDWSRANLAVQTYCAMIDAENAPSRAVARKCGFVQNGDVLYKSKMLGLWTQNA